MNFPGWRRRRTSNRAVTNADTTAFCALRFGMSEIYGRTERTAMTVDEVEQGVSRRGRSVRAVLDAMAAGEDLTPEEEAVLESLKRITRRQTPPEASSGRRPAEEPTGAAGLHSLDAAVRRIVREEIEAALDARGFPSGNRS
ncbi:MAG: hypothetical protein H0V04_07660 [Chloroflexi bacterium]|nr:hypothetical protein [Chloroflexota bacterium]